MPEFSFLDFIFSLAITIIVYSIPIFIARYAVLRRPIARKKAIIVIISYAVFGLIIMTIVSYWVTDGESPASGGGLILWSFVNYKMLTTGKDSRKKPGVPLQNSDNRSPDGVNHVLPANTESQSQKVVLKSYCKKCGSSIDGKTKKCTGCGKQYFKWDWKVFSFVLVCVLLVGTSALSIFQYTAIAELEEESEALQTTIKTLEATAKSRLETILEYKHKVDFLDYSIALVVSDNTDVYHTYDCFHFKNADSYWAYNIAAAESKGYRPCKMCQ